MKKFFIYFLVIVLAIPMCLMGGCKEEDSTKTVEVITDITTVEELYAMSKDGNYRLTNDLDLDGNKWESKSVKNFDGNGHTIKNAIINSSSDIGGGFFYGINEIKNVTFENLTVVISSSSTAFGMVADAANRVSGVTIKDSSAKFINTNTDSEVSMGGILGEMQASENRGPSINGGKFSNNRMENCIIECQGEDFLRVGGLLGSYHGVGSSCQTNSIRQCEVENVKIGVTSNASIYCGGLIGGLFKFSYFGGFRTMTLSTCGAKNTTVSATTTKGNVCIGGAIGFIENMEDEKYFELSKFLVDKCNISGIGTRDVYAGGLVGYSNGRTTNSLCNDNQILGKTTNEASGKLYVGGICGAAKKTIQGCVAQRNKIIGDATNTRYCAGLVGTISDAMAVNSAVNRNIFEGENWFLFSNSEDKVRNSYVIDDGTLAEDITELPILSMQDWGNILNKLNLNEKYWSVDNEGFLQLKY